MIAFPFNLKRFGFFICLGMSLAPTSGADECLSTYSKLENLRTEGKILEVKKRDLQNAQSFIKEMRDCLRNVPPSFENANRVRFFMTEMAIDESIAVLGYVDAAGSDGVDWKTLPTELMVTAFETTVNSLSASGTGSFARRALNLLLMGGVTASADGLIYYLSPLKDTHHEPVDRTSEQRALFHVLYAAGEAPIYISLYELLNGLQCLYPGSAMKMAAAVAQLGYTIGSSTLYYSSRNRFIQYEDTNPGSPAGQSKAGSRPFLIISVKPSEKLFGKRHGSPHDANSSKKRQ